MRYVKVFSRKQVPEPREPAPGREHLAPIAELREPDTRECGACVAQGSGWVHLRLCQSCGNVACCDSSPNRHATAHQRATGHPVIRSIEPGERWIYCYLDREVAWR